MRVLAAAPPAPDYLAMLRLTELETDRFSHPMYLFRGCTIYFLDLSHSHSSSQSLFIPASPSTTSDRHTSTPPPQHQHTLLSTSQSTSVPPSTQLPLQQQTAGVLQVEACVAAQCRAQHLRQLTNLKLQIQLHGGRVAQRMGSDVTHVLLLPGSSVTTRVGGLADWAAVSEVVMQCVLAGSGEAVGAAEFVAALVSAHGAGVDGVQLCRTRRRLESGELWVVGPRWVGWAAVAVPVAVPVAVAGTALLHTHPHTPSPPQGVLRLSLHTAFRHVCTSNSACS